MPLSHGEANRVDFSEVERRMGVTRTWEGWRRGVQGVGMQVSRRESLWYSVAQRIKCGGQNLNIHFKTAHGKEFENVPHGEMTCASHSRCAGYINVSFTYSMQVFK